MAENGNRATLTSSQASEPVETEAQTTEQNMRRALGLSARGSTQAPQQRPEQARLRHRFVQDGGVPVVVLNHKTDGETSALRERIATLDAALDQERTAHEATKRSLHEQQAQTHALQTRLVHADLAHKDALEQERRALTTAQEALAKALAEAAAAPPPRRVARPAPAISMHDATAPQDPANDAPPPDAPIKRKRGRPRSALPKEPKPVRWWTPSFRAQSKR